MELTSGCGRDLWNRPDGQELEERREGSSPGKGHGRRGLVLRKERRRLGATESNTKHWNEPRHPGTSHHPPASIPLPENPGVRVPSLSCSHPWVTPGPLIPPSHFRGLARLAYPGPAPAPTFCPHPRPARMMKESKEPCPVPGLLLPSSPR